MAQDSTPGTDEPPRRRKRRWLVRIPALLVLLLAIAVAYLWWQRNSIAEDYLTDLLDEYGLEAQYEIISIAPGRQVLANIVIGDPARPDLTIARAELHTQPRFGLPDINRITIIEPRLFGTYIDGQLSFGSLDPLIFKGGDEPFEFPPLDIDLRDGRALIEGDLGPVAMRLNGAGKLRDGFTGELAVVAPQLTLSGCEADQATLYGKLAIVSQRPQFTGPLRFDELACEEQGVAVSGGAVQLSLRGDEDLAGVVGRAALRSGAVVAPGATLAALLGEGDFTFRDDALDVKYVLTGREVATSAMDFATLDLSGTLRAEDGFSALEIAADIAGRNLRPGDGFIAALVDAAETVEGTLARPLIDRLRRNLAVQLPGSTLDASVSARLREGGFDVAIPEARLRSLGGDTLLAMQGWQVATGGSDVPFSGNIATGGQGLPRIAGRISQGAGGALSLRLRMAEYAEGSSSLAIPDLRVESVGGGVFDLSGRALASGPLPGGFARNLDLPIEGRVGSDGSVALWPDCVEVAFDGLEISNLTLQRQRLTLCPPSGRTILAMGPGGLRIAAGASSLSLRGELGGTPIAVDSGPVGVAFPGALSARQLNVALGPQGSTVRFTIAGLAAELGGELRGTFEGTDVFLTAVPLDILGASGDWSYGREGLVLSDADFTLADRQQPERFSPLAARGARLTLLDNRIESAFALDHPEAGQLITRVELAHDLSSGIGHADLAVPGVTFTPGGFQPRDLTALAYGVVSLVDGTVTGNGRIDWNAAGTTSTGAFSSDSLDFAAAFGPVKGASGTVRFTDLLGLTTAPNQRLRVASVNPGIEVFDGEIGFSLEGGTVLRVEEAVWPFLGGTLSLDPVLLNLGTSEERRYVFRINGLEAARFIERMELTNLSASGTFDGVIPIVFDAEGYGTLEDGTLTSRPPGGNVSYVGQLTYEDLSFVANFAFEMLRDLDYSEMDIVMNGPLTGELVTRVRLEGVRQGPTAKTNFITRQIAKLPIRLLVNVKAPFYQLISTTRALSDPSSVRDPRSLGLVDAEGRPIRESTDYEEVQERDEAAEAAAEAADRDEFFDEDTIQPPESEAVP